MKRLRRFKYILPTIYISLVLGAYLLSLSPFEPQLCGLFGCYPMSSFALIILAWGVDALLDVVYIHMPILYENIPGIMWTPALVFSYVLTTLILIVIGFSIDVLIAHLKRRSFT